MTRFIQFFLNVYMKTFDNWYMICKIMRYSILIALEKINIASDFFE